MDKLVWRTKKQVYACPLSLPPPPPRVASNPPTLDAEQLLEEAAEGIETTYLEPYICAAGPAGAVVVTQSIDLGCGFIRMRPAVFQAGDCTCVLFGDVSNIEELVERGGRGPGLGL